MFSQEASGGRNGGTAWLRGLARPAALADVFPAGLCTGYLASRLVANEGPQRYCLYTVSVVPAGCTVFHICSGVEIYAVPNYSGAACADSVQVCGGYTALQFGTGSYSGTCPT